MIISVTPAPRRRIEELLALLDSPGMQQVQQRIVVTTLPDPILPDDLPNGTHLITDLSKPPNNINFARWCNAGMQLARDLGAYEILNINSDIRLDPDAVLNLKAALRNNDLSMVGCDFFSEVPNSILIHRETRSYGLTRRVSAACFMTPAEQTLTLDEAYEWYCETDDFEYRCRQLKGTAVVGNATGYQPPDGPLYPPLDQMAKRGMKRFIDIWGALPW